jgi:hypothetical protein
MDVPSRAGHMLVTNLSPLDITVDIQWDLLADLSVQVKEPSAICRH